MWGDNIGLNHNPHFSIELIDLSDNTSVASGGGTNDQTLQPDAGMIYQIVGIEFSAGAPAGDTSGTHEIICQQNGTNKDGIFWVRGNHSTTVTIGDCQFVGDSSERPSQNIEQIKLIHSGLIWASNTNYVTFTYKNDTDANQTGTRTLRVLVKKYAER